jgi:cell division septation protein DedD
MADDAFHEIQLNGKQLVFLFMAATVVAVVIFLCGIMVGRGVRDVRGELAASSETTADPTAGIVAPVAAAPISGAVGVSPATRENLTYPNRLAGEVPTPEPLKEPDRASGAASPPPMTVASAGSEAAPKLDRTTAAPPTSQLSPSEPGHVTADAPTFTVQVAAIKERDEADRIASRLTSKGYPAYVTTPPNSVAPFFRVRVGKFHDRREADAMARRLETEEQFKPWVTR